MMISVDDNYTETKECDYKGEHYSVRDNGAIFRHKKNGKRQRRYDEIWTFGPTENNNGYKLIGSEVVHRIVAYAFLGEPPTNNHIVDHIDTNRKNNRPNNLRWLTKLENILNNPITVARIEAVCGSIVAFLKDPSILKGHEKKDPNFSWMRTVTPDEAKNAYDNLMAWEKKHKPLSSGKLGEWIYEKSTPHYENMSAKAILLSPDNEIQSLTKNAKQINWKTPTAFPLCPQDDIDNPINKYFNNLLPGKVFCQNKYQKSIVIEAALIDDNKSIVIMTKSNDDDALKKWALAKITYKDNCFYHENYGTYFEEKSVQKYYTLAQGLEWTGGTVVDDLC